MQFLSNILAEARGSLNGTVFSRNRAGAYTRGRTKPINPSSDKQSAVRMNFAVVSAAWQNLPLTQINDWNEFAATQTRLNKVGESYTPSGRQLFMEFNTNLTIAGVTIELDPPINPTSPAYLEDAFSFNIEEDAGVLDTLFYTGPILLGDDTVVVQASAPMLASKSSNRIPFKQIGLVDVDTGELVTGYAAVYGNAVAAAQVIKLRLRILSASGVSSDWIYKTNVIGSVGP